MKRNAKIFCAALALVLVFGAVVGGTIAWLTDSTEKVTNTFTVGNIDIELTETDFDKDSNLLSNEFKMVPGAEIEKDPKVTVKANSENCYLFVKIDEVAYSATGNATDGYEWADADLENYITYTPASGWTELTGVEGVKNVYYRQVESSESDASFGVLENDVVNVADDVTKEMMDALATDSTKLPTLSFTAYACQSDNIGSVEDAWEAVSTPAA